MIDLTPLDVRKKRGDFRRILRGYDPEEVDAFLELVEERLEGLVKENLLLTDRTERLQVSVRALEEREKAVQEALVTAQRLREEVHSQSQREVELLKREANAELAQLRREAEAEVERRLAKGEEMLRERQRVLEELERNRARFLKAFRTLLEREMDAVEVEEARGALDDAPLDIELRGWRLSSAEPSGPREGTWKSFEAENPEQTEASADALPDPGEAEAEGEAAGEGTGAEDGETEPGGRAFGDAPKEAPLQRNEPRWLFSLGREGYVPTEESWEATTDEPGPPGERPEPEREEPGPKWGED